MTHYVLVHGAWEGAWSWNYIAPTLKEKGHEAKIIDLPGSDGNPTAISQVTMDAYVLSVVSAINKLDHKVVLVGHSMAGAVISQVAEIIPEKIEKLVYIAAFLLKAGDSVLEAMQRDTGGQFLPELTFSEDQSYATASEPIWRNIAFHDVDEDKIQHALPLLVDVAQATEPFASKIIVSDEKFGSVPKTYIRTAIDKMVTPTLQAEMIDNWKVDYVQVLDSGHFPTMSVPDKLVELLL